MAGPRNPAIEALPAWSGSTFVPVLNNAIPDYLNPSQATLPNPFVAIVTGASRNIGREIAKSFAQAGATGLILTARQASSLEEAKKQCLEVAKISNIKITILSADVAEESAAKAVADAVRNEHGGHLDLLVNNAGILNVDPATAFNPVGEIGIANIIEPMRTNYFGRIYLIQHLVPFLKATTSGAQAIVNISSLGSHVSGPLGFSMTALANNRLSQRVDESYAEEGIVCYAIHPGAVIPEGDPSHLPQRMIDFSLTKNDLCGAWLVWLVKEKRQWLSGRYMDATWDPHGLEEKRDEIVKEDKLKMRLLI